MLHVRRSALKALYAGAFIASALCLALAGCATTATATSTATATGTTQALATDTPQPSAPQPTPLPAGTFTTYTNTTYGYSIAYPQNWSVVGADATAQSFTVFNYNPQTYQQPSSAPPLLKVEIDIVSNPDGLSSLDLFKQTASGPGQPAATITSAQATSLAGHTATLIDWTSAASRYPAITYVYIAPHMTTALFISQSNATGGEPSPVFTRMLASLTITG